MTETKIAPCTKAGCFICEMKQSLRKGLTFCTDNIILYVSTESEVIRCRHVLADHQKMIQ